MNEDNFVSNEGDGEEVNSLSKKKSKKIKISITILIVVLIILSGVYYFGLGDVFKSNKVVAVVNGEKITNSEVSKRLEQISSLAEKQGVDTSDSNVIDTAKSRILDELIDTKLLIQGAKDAGIVPDDEATNKEIQSIIDKIGGDEAYKKQLNKIGVTEEKFRNDVKERLVIQEYIAQNVDLESIKITNKEISDFYQQISATQGNIPPLKEIRPQISSQLLSNKKQEAIVAFVATLREGADVKISL